MISAIEGVFTRTPLALHCKSWIINGPGEGNRTLVIITSAAVAWRSPSAFVNGTFAKDDGMALFGVFGK